MFMKRINLLVTGAAVCLALSGCSGDHSEADEGQAVSLQDMARDMSKEGEVASGSVQDEAGTAIDSMESTLPTVNPATADVRDRNLEKIKSYLAQYSDSLQELEKEECYVVLHGEEYSGREYLDSFMGNVETETSGELVIVQFTVEGDPVFYYLNADAGDVYCVEDISRDAWAGNGEKYFEKIYDSVWLSGEADTEGNYYLSLYALQEQDIVVELFTAATEEPLMCGLPPAESSVTGQASQAPPQTETESKLPGIEERKENSDGEGNCIEIHDLPQSLPEWAKPPAP